MMRLFFAWLTVGAIIIVVLGLFVVKPEAGSSGSVVVGFALIYLILAFIYRLFTGAGYIAATALGQNDEQLRSRHLQDELNSRMIRELDRRASVGISIRRSTSTMRRRLTSGQWNRIVSVFGYDR